MKVVGVLLAGGRSKRFGKDKRFHIYKGKSFIDRCIETMSEVFDEFYISAEKGFNYKDYNVIYDIENYKGPLYAIYSVMKSLKREAYVFTVVDMPFISSKTLLEILKALLNYEVVCIKVGGNISFPVGLKFKVLTDIEGFISAGGSSVMKFLISQDCKFLHKEPFMEFMNINRPEDLQDLNQKHL